MREILIGDVHGCLKELQQLIEAVDPTRDDTVVFLGDLMDKGPDTVGVIRYVLQLRDRCHVVVLRGNHEDAHIRYWQGGNRDHFCADVMAQTERMMTEQEKRYIATLPMAYRLANGDLAVHGGIPLTMTTTPELLTHKQAFPVMRTRYVDGETLEPLMWNDTRPNRVFWATLYDGRFGHVWFGHEIHDAATEYRHATCIDTGCFKGGALTAVILKANKRTHVAVRMQQ